MPGCTYAGGYQWLDVLMLGGINACMYLCWGISIPGCTYAGGYQCLDVLMLGDINDWMY